MDLWNILQKLKKCKNLTKSVLGGVRCLKRGRMMGFYWHHPAGCDGLLTCMLLRYGNMTIKLPVPDLPPLSPVAEPRYLNVFASL